MDKRKYNASGYKDMTAFYAIENVSREEKQSKERLNKLLRKILKETEKAGFHLENRLVLKDKETGRVWR